ENFNDEIRHDPVELADLRLRRAYQRALGKIRGIGLDRLAGRQLEARAGVVDETTPETFDVNMDRRDDRGGNRRVRISRRRRHDDVPPDELVPVVVVAGSFGQPLAE